MSDKSQSNLNDEVETIEEAEFRLEEKKWSYRRGIAQKAFISILATLFGTFGMFLFKDDISNFSVIENVVITIVLGLVSIVGFYFGATTWADKGKK